LHKFFTIPCKKIPNKKEDFSFRIDVAAETIFFAECQSKVVPSRSGITPFKIVENPLKVKVQGENWFVKSK
jgi:hypothetical protein